MADNIRDQSEEEVLSDQSAETSGNSQVPGELALVVSDDPDRPPLSYPVVGIGASAVGVEAYVELFRSLPSDTGMTFLVIPHPQPDHKSRLVEIIARVTRMPVAEIRDGITPESDHVYVLPPGSHVRLENGVLRLQHRPEGISRPIDHFFRSLAADQKTRAVGVVLSGTDSDGDLGLEAIKDEGGITMVESREMAQFPEMPRNRISNDHVDRILPPGSLANELAQLAAQFRDPLLRAMQAGAPQSNDDPHFFRILNLLRGVSGIDFRLYKPATVRRRVARRMMLHRLRTFAEYAAFLQSNLEELRHLQEDTLIGVTRFFRDPPVFDALKRLLLPRMFEGRPEEQQVRFWVAGCATGEEAYSLAICLLEHLTTRQSIEPPIRIFATDASESNIQRARTGIYPESIATEVSAERLRRFFVKVDKGYQVSKRVRDLCIFARQNLCQDPPFSKMDLISCRNVLIYLGAEAQKQILRTFHYALRPNGHLLLGIGETIQDCNDLFESVDRRHKFFAKTGCRAARTLFPDHRPFGEAWGEVALQRAADRLVLERYGPPGVIVNEALEIIQSRGHTSPYLEMPQGSVTLHLARMLRASIAGPVEEAVHRAIAQDIPVRVYGLHVGDDGDAELTVEVLPIHTAAPLPRRFLVLFTEDREQDRKAAKPDRPPADAPERDPRVDAHNQELVTAHEEIQSANEELQSINEELQQRNAVLTRTTNDLSSLLNSVNLPVLMLDNELRIRHFTPPTQRLMNLRPSDIGRLFGEIRLNLAVEDLRPVFTEVLETLTPREMEVQDSDQHWRLLRVRPYRTTENKIDGIVVVLLDIDQLRRSQQELRGARDFSRSVIENVPLPLVLLDVELSIRAANDAFRALVGVAAEPLHGRYLPDLAAVAWGLNEPLRRRLEGLRSKPDANSNFELDFTVAGKAARTFHIRGRVLEPDAGVFLLVTLEDITAQIEAARLLSEERAHLATQVETAARELGRTQEDLRALASSLFTSHEGERRRVARELHDDVCQKLAALEIGAQQAAQRMTAEPEQALAELALVRSGIASLSDDVRALSHGLYPSVIDDLGLAPALRALLDDFRDREGMIGTFSAQRLPEKISGEIATGLYRIAQEALRNVSRHAGKSHVKVILAGNGAAIRLQVIDSGEGFDVLEPRSGLGLISMEERARMMGGTFRVESELGEGARVTVEVPLPGPADDRQE